MVFFCFTNDGQTIKREFRMGKAPASIRCGGKRYVRDIPAEHRGDPPKKNPWPKKSDALGVLHSQIGEAAQHLAEEGVPTQFTNDGTGRCVVESNEHQNRIMEVLGIHDRDACYRQRAKP